MTDTIIVSVLVVLAAVWVGRTLWKRLSGKESGCNCGQTCPGAQGACPAAKDPFKNPRSR